MKKHLKVYHMRDHTPEWYAFRENGIGGSECATVLGISRYSTGAKLFHEKVGTHPPIQFDNERMFWGRNVENNIADVWRYWDNTHDGYIENYNNKKIVRNCRNINGYVVNPKYPWLFASIDRLMNKEGGINFITGEALDTEAVLECKNMGHFASKSWEDGMPVSFLVQVHQYMIILETDYAEVAILVDGGNLQVEKIQRDDELCERIIQHTKSFWNDRVVPAKKAFKNRELADADGRLDESEKWEAEIQRLEPDPDASEAYTEFMNEQFVKERDSVDGTMELFSLAKQHHFFNGIAKLATAQKNLVKNNFTKFLTQKGSEAVDFGKMGYASWSERKGAKQRTFSNRTKDKPTETFMEEEFKKLNPNF